MKTRHSSGHTNQIALAILLSIILLPALSLGASSTFLDNFESGNLDNWVIGGRQLGTNKAEVVSRGGSQVAHLYHRYFTEITLHRDFDYDPEDVYQFDLEVDTHSTGGAPSNYYGWSYVSFGFLNSADEYLGYVWYGAATTSHPFNNAASDPTVAGNAVPENTMRHFEVSVADMLSQITINEDIIDNVRMRMVTYSSTWPSPDVTAQLWIDNVQLNAPGNSTIPAPGAIMLAALGVGLVSSMRRRRTL